VRRRRWRRGAHRRRSGDEGKTTTSSSSEEVGEGEGASGQGRPLFDDTKFAVELLRSAFKKLEGVGEAFDIKAYHDVYKDPSVKGLSFRIHRLAEKLENLPVVKRAAPRHFFFDDGGSDGDDGSHDGETPTN
jgi:hypothetical protein